ncbi:cupin domain-containing protein [Herbaspirillum sp. GCM10030257]|uniref:(R)-mandelonitrile lyase n=1 Tax=Herbaspirillum sp. GCM10030257 TaxID=3273393 RepID=UPI003612A7D8
MKNLSITALPLLLLACAGVHASDAATTGAPTSGGEQHKTSQTITRAGSQPSAKGPAEYFTGNVRVDPLFPAKDSAPVSGGRVTFEPGARSAWHTHPAGQHLIVTEGVGWTQEWGGPVAEIRAGDVVWCPPGVKHWHGASPSTSMTHVAITGTVNGKNVEWLEKVTDTQYRK